MVPSRTISIGLYSCIPTRSGTCPMRSQPRNRAPHSSPALAARPRPGYWSPSPPTGPPTAGTAAESGFRR